MALNLGIGQHIRRFQFLHRFLLGPTLPLTGGGFRVVSFGGWLAASVFFDLNFVASFVPNFVAAVVAASVAGSDEARDDVRDEGDLRPAGTPRHLVLFLLS